LASALVFSTGSCRKSPVAPTALPVTSNFDQNNEGWSVVGDGLLTYESTGGNPSTSGYILGVDRLEGDVFYFNAPSKFRGNASAAYGRLLTFDLVWSENLSDKDVADIILQGDGLTITAKLPAPPGNSWTSYSIRLDVGGGWVRQGTTQAVTAAQIQSVLASLQQLRIRGEYRDGSEQSGLDNVRFGI
jgi:hypothetical protein